jgi:hypothetical protein
VALNRRLFEGELPSLPLIAVCNRITTFFDHTAQLARFLSRIRQAVEIG